MPSPPSKPHSAPRPSPNPSRSPSPKPSPSPSPLPRTVDPRARRALSAIPGSIRSDGDPAAAALLASAFAAAHDADPRELTHGFHSYPARFHPRLVRTILTARAKRGSVICDPFCGSGTTLVEALLVGARGVGSDLNPLSLELARVKALAPSPSHLALPDELVEAARALCEESIRRVKARARTMNDGTAWDDPAMYAPHVFRELVGLRELFDRPSVVPKPLGAMTRRALLLCFSAILIKVSRQPSETAAGVQERAIGKTLPSRMFLRKAEELAVSLRALFSRTPAGTPNPTVHKADARKLKHLEDASVDLIITSPPYLGTYDYASHHARRLGWLGLDATGLEQHEIGARRDSDKAASPAMALTAWQHELNAVAKSMARVLKPGASAFIVMGDSRVGTRGVAGDRGVRMAAQHARLTVRAAAAEQRTSMGGQKGPRQVEEHLLELVRP